MNALLLLKKPSGISSTRLGSYVKRVISINFLDKKKLKLGHVGTLDQEASGLLLLLTGSATRFQSHLLDFDKVYSGYIRLGFSTSTDDIYGDVLEEIGADMLKDSSTWPFHINKIISLLGGLRTQLAPVVSAKKINGVSSYKRVRRGENVERKSKEVSLDVIDLRFVEQDRMYYKIKVSSGFYVRSFAREIGEILGTGAVAETIHRDSIGPFILEDSVSLEELGSDISLFSNEMKDYSWCLSMNDIAEVLGYSSRILSDADSVARFKQGQMSIISAMDHDEGFTIVNDISNNPLGVIEKRGEDSRFCFVF
ncbi:MAG TPA: tRNA pseudouridine(55) synthase TruB [Oligoflexia bacterium]|nr:tRNA pseudouridine(55) synthase TruB [Oligoflexia bacterium]HMP49086.1 tRNA pseudouridine(55) synthase TruB [Oligoflexia bacterium]